MVTYPVGIVFEGYRDEVLIGEGGLGRVYRATRESTGGTVAIKSLRDVEDSSPAWHRANREVEAMLRVKGHPYVVTVEEIFRGPEGPCLVMEFLPGGSIADRGANGPITDPELVLIGQHVTEALIAAHEVGIVHRDIKPANLMIGAFGQVKVGDFGISALVRGEHQTKTASLTLAYASPEELDGDQRVGPPADVFSLAATMHHLLTGIRPTFGARIHGWPSIDGRDAAMAPVIAAIEAGLAPDIASRPTMQQFSAAFDRSAALLGDRAIKRFDGSVATVVRGEPTEPPTHEPSSKRLPLILAGVSAALVLAIGAAAVLTSGDGDDPPAITSGASDGTLQIAGLFPTTGGMSVVAAAPRAGAQLAVDEINAAGGVLGEPLDFVVADTGSTGRGAVAAFTALETPPDVVIGPISNDVGLQLVETTRPAGVLTITPAATDDLLVGDLFVRLVASNAAQGRAIGSLIAASGAERVAIVGIDAPAPRSIMDAAAGGDLDVVLEQTFGTADVSQLVDDLLADDLDAVLISAFEEDTAAVIDAIAEASGGTIPFALFGTDANTGGNLAGLVSDPTLLDGMVGTFVASPSDDDLLAELVDLADPTYAAEAYDSVVLAALAATAAGSDDAGSIETAIVDVSSGGVECTRFAECVDLLTSGEDIRYAGRSGELDLTGDLERATAPILVFRYDAAGSFDFDAVIQQG